ncbi:MAG: 30S ribosome-binding factor RbfA [Betaproteobacteria bacterium]|nr:MAG: 30S ribosome-binding factor RbfA [Betaproteobacteria bacterium]
MARTAGRAGTSRGTRVGDQIQRVLSEILRRELRDPRVGMITITAVEMSPDCAHATVYFTCLEADHVPAAAAGLKRAAGFLRSQLGRSIQLYVTPQLRFVYDASVERGARLSHLIDSVQPKR